MPVCTKKKGNSVLLSLVVFMGHNLLSLPAYYICKYIFTDRAEVGFCPQVSVCGNLLMCAHACVQKSPSFMNYWCREHVLFLIYSVAYPCCVWGNCAETLNSALLYSLFLTLHRSFFLFFLLSTIWMLDWDFSLPVRVTFQAQTGAGGSGAALCQGCPPHVQGHAGRCRWPRYPTALMLPDSCDCIQEGRAEQEHVSVLCFYFWLCCEK